MGVNWLDFGSLFDGFLRVRRPFVKDVNANEILRNAIPISDTIYIEKRFLWSQREAGGKALVPLRNVFLFIVLTVGLESHLKSKQINVYWAVKASPSQCNNVLADI